MKRPAKAMRIFMLTGGTDNYRAMRVHIPVRCPPTVVPWLSLEDTVCPAKKLANANKCYPIRACGERLTSVRQRLGLDFHPR